MTLFLFGHSMGSTAVQRYIMLYGSELCGAILSGSISNHVINLYIVAMMDKIEIKRIGPKSLSYILHRLTIGSFNNCFKPNRSEFDWLSRDNEEVDKYINDPYCGTVFTAEFFYDYSISLKKLFKKANLNLIPKDLPIYIFSREKENPSLFCIDTLTVSMI